LQTVNDALLVRAKGDGQSVVFLSMKPIYKKTPPQSRGSVQFKDCHINNLECQILQHSNQHSRQVQD